MPQSQAAASCSLSESEAVVPVNVDRKCTLTYTFDTSASEAPELAIPYAVSVDGKQLAEFSAKPKRVEKTRKIQLKVAPGSTVALYLNSDAHPAYRQTPVYEVKVGQRDVEVQIKEQRGRISHFRPQVGISTCRVDKGRAFDFYSAFLTGDIWMQISHVYSAEESQRLIPTDVPTAIRDAVVSIYRVLKDRRMTIRFPSTDGEPEWLTTVEFKEQNDVTNNTSNCPLLREVLPRTHPMGFVALFTVAQLGRINSLTLSSCWRPSTGSIAHRAGLGLDVVAMQKEATNFRFNRVGLKDGARNENLSDEERRSYHEYELAKAERERLEKLSDAAQSDLRRHSGRNDEADYREKSEQIDARLAAARVHELEAKKESDAVLRKHEPSSMRDIRDLLSRQPSIVQILDPWYIDFNTKDKKPGTPNEQMDATEKAHAHHLHITIAEPKIL